MTRDDIIRMAREIATQCCNRTPSWRYEYAMSRIMELLDANAAIEREECANVCDGIEQDKWALYKGLKPYSGAEEGRADSHIQGWSDGAGDCAEAIRARSEK